MNIFREREREIEKEREKEREREKGRPRAALCPAGTVKMQVWKGKFRSLLWNVTSKVTLNGDSKGNFKGTFKI